MVTKLKAITLRNRKLTKAANRSRIIGKLRQYATLQCIFDN
jgi:hypothetical protein